ncbi:uncharacterized protein BCR38DRAFT_479898 [Pseudomassariella vexata]|uniref:Uncharacterized protein n=1 Tax=Pseudomassariella vexata TaxID=1141098 RepID=A0A1Y2EIJ7_9PEZI|nr:uncharacterized protein BCR38DRAFT_479898 [Pseudomassariella vexata]ORY71402.1 hypothetical protein BCR38DRAFT_479898 [Pseudomassariella vexata]
MKFQVAVLSLAAAIAPTGAAPSFPAGALVARSNEANLTLYENPLVPGDTINPSFSPTDADFVPGSYGRGCSPFDTTTLPSGWTTGITAATSNVGWLCTLYRNADCSADNGYPITNCTAGDVEGDWDHCEVDALPIGDDGFDDKIVAYRCDRILG